MSGDDASSDVASDRGSVDLGVNKRMEARQASKLFRHFSSSRSKSESIELSWKDVNYSIAVKDAQKSKIFAPVYGVKHILNDLSGSAKSGELLAIMGPTGCGKTSLLNLLAARVSASGSKAVELTGSVTVNGRPRHDDSFRKISSYVLQDDRLFPHLTVCETLFLAAQFYLSSEVSTESKYQLVESVMEELGLAKTRDTIIGDEKVRGVSGGERKRANIAVQLISDPAILFLDEPTSGLDSFQALACIDSMKAMALNGRLIVTVIHQPRSSIFDTFDKLLLLSEGRTMYLGDAHSAIGYFTSTGFSSPRFFNPADFFLDILSPDHRTEESEQRTMSVVHRLGDQWAAAEVATDKNREEENRQQKGAETETVAVAADTTQIKQTRSESFELQKSIQSFYLLFWRAWKEQSRAWNVTAIKMFTSVFFGLIIGGIYSRTGYDQAGIRSREGLLFVIVLNQAFNVTSSVYNTFPKEKMVTNRERAGNAYNTLVYFLSKYVAELPLNVLPSLLFGTIVYWMAGLNPDRFGPFFGILLLEVACAIALGLSVSAAAPTVEAASAIGIPFVIVPLLFGGFYINLDSLNSGVDLVPYISFIKWAFQAMMINEFKGETFNCSGGSTSQCLKTGQEVLDSLSMGTHSLSYALFGLSMMFLGYLLIAVWILFRNKPTYLPLNSVGALYAKHITPELLANDAAALKGKYKYSPVVNSAGGDSDSNGMGDVELIGQQQQQQQLQHAQEDSGAVTAAPP